MSPNTWIIDMEYGVRPCGRPIPRCAVAIHAVSGDVHERWFDGDHGDVSPFELGDDSEVVLFSSTADLPCFDVLGWPRPESVIDAHVEFRCWTNGHSDTRTQRHQDARHGSLISALRWIGHPDWDAQDKEHNRSLALRGGPYTDDEQRQLLDYCRVDVEKTLLLLNRMGDEMSWPQARLRGMYMQCLATVEQHGLPVDMGKLNALRNHREAIRYGLIDEVNTSFHVYEQGRFKIERFHAYIQSRGWQWPMTDTGWPKVDKDTLSDMAKCYPELTQLKELRKLLGQLDREALVVDQSGRNRVAFRAFQTVTGRNAPSTNRFIMGLSKVFRALLRPEHGQALIELDYQQQEFGIAASLSGDLAMLDAYKSGDPYLAFAKQAGAAPGNATKQSHPEVRHRFKVVSLGVLYGMGARSLSLQVPCTETEARCLLDTHHRVYRTFWAWLEQVEHEALERRYIQTEFGWRMWVDARTKPRTLMNWPMQANGAEMLRLALTYCVTQKIKVIAPVHDALLIEAPESRCQEVAEAASARMRQASEDVLRGFALRVDCVITHYPNHFPTHGDGHLWQVINRYLENNKEAVNA